MVQTAQDGRVWVFVVVTRHFHPHIGRQQPALQVGHAIDDRLRHQHRVRAGTLHLRQADRRRALPAITFAGQIHTQLSAVLGPIILGHVAAR